MTQASGVGEIGQLYREHAGRLLGSLMRSFGDLDIAEEALQDAVEAAVQRWPVDGVPREPAGWLLAVARNRALDRVRRENQRSMREEAATARAAALRRPWDEEPAGERGDDQLRLLFMCCHPALGADAQAALTLRSLGGLTTAEIASAYLVDESTMAQRLVRAKHKIRATRIPFSLPSTDQLAARLGVVMRVIYLVFNEGYLASAGASVVRVDLCTEAIAIARTVRALVPDEPEPAGLLALMLLHDSRRATREDDHGDIVLLEHQDRTRWNRAQIDEGATLVESALMIREVGPYQVEAAIAALHATAMSSDETDWPQIVALYGVLQRIAPSPVIDLNRAVAVGMADGPEAGLAALGDVAGLERSHHLHAARSLFLQRSGRRDEAIVAIDAALALVSNEPERRLLERRRAVLTYARRP